MDSYESDRCDRLGRRLPIALRDRAGRRGGGRRCLRPRDRVPDPAAGERASLLQPGRSSQRARDFRTPQTWPRAAGRLAVEARRARLLVRRPPRRLRGPCRRPRAGRRGGRGGDLGRRSPSPRCRSARDRPPAREGRRPGRPRAGAAGRGDVAKSERDRRRVRGRRRRGARRRDAALRPRAGGCPGTVAVVAFGAALPSTPGRSCSTRSSTSSRRCPPGRRAATCSSSPARRASTSARSTRWTPRGARRRPTRTSPASGRPSAS